MILHLSDSCGDGPNCGTPGDPVSAPGKLEPKCGRVEREGGPPEEVCVTDLNKGGDIGNRTSHGPGPQYGVFVHDGLIR